MFQSFNSFSAQVETQKASGCALSNLAIKRDRQGDNPSPFFVEKGAFFSARSGAVADFAQPNRICFASWL